MRRLQPIDELPADHRRLQSGFVFHGVDDNGIEFELRFTNVRRQVSSSGIVKAQVKAMQQGRPLMQKDFYQEEPSLILFVPRRQRTDIRINPNGTYSVGRYVERTLKGIVGNVLRAFAPRPGPTPPDPSGAGPAP